MRKLLYLVFITIILLSVFVLPQLLIKLPQLSRSLPLSATGANSKLCLSSCSVTSSTVTIYSNQPFSIPVLVDTDNASIDGVDLMINFDHKALFLVKINLSAQVSTNLKRFTPDIKTILKGANTDGLIKLSLNTINNSFEGTATLAIFTFQPKMLGKTDIGFNFTPGPLNDTNLMRDNQDILASVINQTLTIVAPKSTPDNKAGISNNTSAKLGDLNADGIVDDQDYQILLKDFGKTGSIGFSMADIDKNGKVDIFDLNLLNKNKSK